MGPPLEWHTKPLNQGHPRPQWNVAALRSVSLSVRTPILASAILASVALAGCGQVQQVAKGVGDQVSKDTWHPDKATNDSVVIHVYLDRNGASLPQRSKMGLQLANLLELYPDTVLTSVYWYGDKTSKVKNVFCSRLETNVIIDEFINDPSPPKSNTYLSRAVDDLVLECDRAPDKLNVGIFVTDGGFQDDPVTVKNSVLQLAKRKNATMLMFIGLESDGGDKLSILDRYVKDPYVTGPGKYYDVALKGNETMLASARTALKTLVTSGDASQRT